MRAVLALALAVVVGSGCGRKVTAPEPCWTQTDTVVVRGSDGRVVGYVLTERCSVRGVRRV